MSKFQLGQIVMTAAVAERFGQDSPFVLQCLDSHAQGDWGTLDAEDVAANNDAVANGSRILSSYPITRLAHGPNEKLWIITEAEPRDSTTILFPSDY